VAAIQSSFIPWRGYFDFIRSVDIFVIYDDVQYSTGSWRNRNKIKTPRGTEWITVPVRRSHLGQRIDEVEIDYGKNWQKKHEGAWLANYKAAPYYDLLSDILDSICAVQYRTISELNVNLIHKLCAFLEIGTPLLMSSTLALKGNSTERLIEMIKKLGGTNYLSGPSADGYLDRDVFAKNGIQLEYKTYDYSPYPQLWGNFVSEVSVLDLIANCGSLAKKHIHSRTKNKIIVPT
jgi:hypothetical protein